MCGRVVVECKLVVVLGRIVAIVVLLLLNGFFVAVEFSLVRSRRTRLEAMARGGDRFARIALRGIANLGRMLSASQLGITLASLGLGALTEETLADIFSECLHTLPVALRAGVAVGAGSILAITFVTYFPCRVSGEPRARSVALTHPEKVRASPRALRCSCSSSSCGRSRFILNNPRKRYCAFLGRSHAVEEALHSPEELSILVEQSEGAACSIPRRRRCSRACSSSRKKTRAR